MEEDKRQRFQGKCFQSWEGRRFMERYDKMSPRVRVRLRESPFNLCVGCVLDHTAFFAEERNIDNRLIKSIERMEDLIRAGN